MLTLGVGSGGGGGAADDWPSSARHGHDVVIAVQVLIVVACWIKPEVETQQEVFNSCSPRLAWR
jgi:hypothetical protein